MKKEDWLGISYVSIWVIIWGTLGSLIDYPLLQKNIYAAGSTGQYSTFTITALISIVIGAQLFSNFMNKFGK
ncbi:MULTISPECIES: hypothetical protein [Prochlorococcus]|uniref:hypothetical protein n=1 Tax=Prochlorococcus TaxID=1218 RepID=UPI000533729A|nr:MULTISPECIES: hypothetical protein [Prochlorococcus]KGG11962.1 hypothetical protein EV05_1164 [Prochlorococcus sp. MIT 0601]